MVRGRGEVRVDAVGRRGITIMKVGRERGERSRAREQLQSSKKIQGTVPEQLTREGLNKDLHGSRLPK